MILGNTNSPSFKVNKNDDYNTPVQAWQFLLNNMQQEAKNSIIWCPFYHDGSLIKILKDFDHIVFHILKRLHLLLLSFRQAFP